MASYNESDPCPFDLDQSTPTEGATPPSEVNNAIREIKRAFKNVNRIKTVTAATTLTEEDNCAICSSSGPFTLKLPLIANVCNATMTKPYEVYNIGSATVTVSGNGATIADATQLELSQQYGGYRMLPDGTRWNLQGKWLDKPTIADFTNMTHNHSATDTGGRLGIINASEVNVDGTIAASNFVGGVVSAASLSLTGAASVVGDISCASLTAAGIITESGGERVLTYTNEASSETSALTFTSPGSILKTLDLGTVTAGDVFFLSLRISGNKGATAGHCTSIFKKSSGTGTILPVSGVGLVIGPINDSYQIASTSWSFCVNEIFRVTVSGTYVIGVYAESKGSDSSSGKIALGVAHLIKQ